jgi:hypothetical protein
VLSNMARGKSLKTLFHWVCMSRIGTLDLPSGKRLHSYGKSLLLMGKSTISTGPFSSSLFVCLPGRVLDDKSSSPWNLPFFWHRSIPM